MPLHVGDDRYVHPAEVVAILDHAIFVRSRVNTHFLHLARGEGRLMILGEHKPKESATVVVTGREVIISPLSHRTLARRAQAGPLRSIVTVSSLRRKPS